MRRFSPLFLVIAAACASMGGSSAPKVEFRARPGAAGPFSEAVRVDNLLFMAGQLGTVYDTATKRNILAPGGIAAETRAALENIKGVLERNGLGMENVVKCTAMLADIAEWGQMNAVYTTYFPVNKPARSAFATNGLVNNARIELECIAALK